MTERMRTDVKEILITSVPMDSILLGDLDRMVPIGDWAPRDPLDFGIEIQILAGTAEDRAGDAFEVTVCSPRWLATHWEEALEGFVEKLPGGVVPGRHFWFMQRWDPHGFQQSLDRVLDKSAAGSWDEIANRLGRYLPWEFDYQYDEANDKAAGLEKMDYEQFVDDDDD